MIGRQRRNEADDALALTPTNGPLLQLEKRSIRSGMWFKGLDVQLQDAMVSQTMIWRVGHRRLLSSQGTVPEVWFGIASGAVRVTTLSADGKESVVDVLTAGEWFGDVPLLTTRSQPYSCHALGPCALLMMRRSTLRELIAKHPSLAEELARLNWENGLRVMDRQAAFMTQTLESRVRVLIATLGREIPSPLGRRALPEEINQAELASLVGASRQRFNQAMSNVTQRGQRRSGARA
jgi:CRP-like cAMP-binding protein